MEPTIITYLTDLQNHNNREWYHEHKEEYRAANEAFEKLIRMLIEELGKDEPELLRHEPKELTFKLVRDTRFSHDKSPYNPSFRCHISAAGKLPVPVGYFIAIRPGGQSFLGGGLFADMFKDATAMIRDHITAHGEEWQEIIGNPEFSGLFTVDGTKLKKVPQGYDPDHPQAEYLKHKSWYLEYFFDDEKLDDPEAFVEFAADIFRRMKPFNDFLNRALEGFKMPER